MVQCEESSILDRLLSEPDRISSTTTITMEGGRVGTASITPRPEGMFDVILLGGGGDDSEENTAELVMMGTKEAEEFGVRKSSDNAKRTPAERLALVLDK